MRYTVHRGHPPDLLSLTNKEETAMAVIQAPFGATWEGQAVDRFTLRSGPAEAEIITFEIGRASCRERVLRLV